MLANVIIIGYLDTGTIISLSVFAVLIYPKLSIQENTVQSKQLHFESINTWSLTIHGGRGGMKFATQITST